MRSRFFGLRMSFWENRFPLFRDMRQIGHPKKRPPETRAVSFSQIVTCALLGSVHVRERASVGLGRGLGAALSSRDPLRERRRGGGDQKGGNNKDLELGH